MNFKEFDPKDLVKPSDFQLISQDTLFEDTLQTVNDELQRLVDNGEEIYEGSDATVEMTFDEDELQTGALSADIISRIKQTYQEVGWKDVTYKFEEEDEDNYAVHTFAFHFNFISNTFNL